MRSRVCFLLAASCFPLLPIALPAQQRSALLKSDLVRFLTGTTYSQGEIAAMVRRSCLAFTPTERDRRDLRELGATPIIFRAIDSCVQGEQRASAPARTPTPTRTQAAARAPDTRAIELSIVGRVDTAVAGTVASFPVALRRGGEGVRGVRLVLRGTDSIPGGARGTLAAVTDSRGHTLFTVPVGSRVGTYQLTVAAADSTTLTGEDAILLTVLAAPPSTATLSPITLAITPGTRETRAIVVAVADSFGNPVARQSVQLRPPPSRPVFPVQLHRTSDSGTARFELPTAALRAGDTLTVVANGRVLASLPVTAAERVVARAKEAPPRAAAQSSAPRPADERLPDVDPSDAAALTARAESRSVAGDYSGARRDLDAALRAGADRGTVLTVLGYNSLRGGDYAAAADQFQQALRADPRHAAAATGLAYAELWRDDPRQASRRFDVLRSSPPPSYPADAAEKFRDGIARAARRDLTGAERALSAAVAAAPSWADAYYNRALVLEATDQAERAAPDFRRYLQLRPAASDRSSVARRITVLGRTPVDALTRGLMAPGLGQFYTGRPAIGAAVLAGVVGSTALALNQRTTTETRTFTNPFGRRYTDEVTVTKRPHLTAGLAAAGAIWLLGAMEASLHVANARGDVSLPSTPSSRAGTESRLRLLPVVALEPTGPAFGAAAVVGFR